MKKVIILGLIILISNTAWSTNWYQKGDKLYVWANPSLNIRNGNSINDKIIETLKYGDEIIVLETKIARYKSRGNFKVNPFKNKENEKGQSFELTGNWVKIKFNEIEGYIFDGYISKLPVIDKEKDKNSENRISIKNYMSRIDSILSYKLEENQSLEGLRYEKWISRSGITYSLKSSEGSSDEELIISGVSMEEGFLFLKEWKYCIDDIDERMKYDNYTEFNSTSFFAELEGRYLSLIDTGGSIVINYHNRD